MCFLCFIMVEFFSICEFDNHHLVPWCHEPGEWAAAGHAACSQPPKHRAQAFFFRCEWRVKRVSSDTARPSRGKGVPLEWGDGFLKGGFCFFFLTSWPRNFLQNHKILGLLSALLYEGTWQYITTQMVHKLFEEAAYVGLWSCAICDFDFRENIQGKETNEERLKELELVAATI